MPPLVLDCSDQCEWLFFGQNQIIARAPFKINQFMYKNNVFFFISAKLAIFATDMLWESCCKLNLEQLSYSMFCKNIAHLAVIQKIYIIQGLES